MKTWCSSIVFLGALAAAVAVSQPPAPPAPTQRAIPPRPYVRPGYGYYGGGYGNYSFGGGSTAAGSYMTGMSNVIRAQGAYNLATSEAAISAEQARTLDLENRKLATQTYFEMRKMNEEYRAAEAAKHRPTPEQVARYSSKPLPSKLKPTQYDPVSGQITWPAVLEGSDLATYRDGLQGLFTRLAQSQGSTSMVVRPAEVQFYTDAMRADLDKRVSQMSSQDWIDAKRFLESLSYEATRVAM